MEFELEAGLGDLQFRSHEASLKASRYGVIRFNFNRLRLKHRLRNLMLDDFIEVVGDYAESFELIRRYYHGTTLGPSEALPIDAAPVDLTPLEFEVVLSSLLNAIFALAARSAVTREVLEKWTASAGRAGLATVVGAWINFVEALFVSNTSNAEAAVRDPSLSWPWQVTALVRVAIDRAVGPVELFTIHDYWTNVLRQAAPAMLVLSDVERLVTSAWHRLAEQGFRLRAPGATAPALLQACDSVSRDWKKIGEVLVAACDAVPAMVPEEVRRRLQGL